MKKTELRTITKRAVSHEDILKLDPGQAQAVFNALTLEEKVDVVLGSPWVTRQKLIVLAMNPAELVQALPEEEIYWTVKEIGPEDALPIISRLSFDQLQYIIDIDCWDRDFIDMAAVTRWLKMLLRCKEENVLEWVTKTDEHFLNFVFKKLFTVFRISEDIDLAESSDQFPSWTIDGQYYYQFTDDEARLIAIPFLHLIYRTDSKYFYYLMENTRWASAVELEESVLRMQQRRMSEQGFTELDEAWQIYQHMSLEEISLPVSKAQRDKKTVPAPAALPPKLRYFFTQGRQNLFVHAVFRLMPESEHAARVQREILALTNTLMIADCVTVREAGDREKSLRKVLGYVNISLELLSGLDADAAADLLEHVPVRSLFRAGYSQALDLQKRLLCFRDSLHTIDPELTFDFFGTPLDEMAAGLSTKRPLFFEGMAIKESYACREFESLEDVLVIGKALDRMAVIKTLLFDCFGISGPDDLKSLALKSTLNDMSELRAQQLFLTVLARQVMYRKTEAAPITVSALRKFIERVFTLPQTPGMPAAVLSQALLPDAMNWLRQQCRFDADIMPAVQDFVRDCLYALEQECGALAGAREIDARYIQTLLLKK